MFIRSQTPVAGKSLLDAILAALVIAVPAAILDITSKVRLFKVGPVPNKDMVFADFTEPTFTGYATVTLASVLGPHNIPNGRMVHKEVDFACTADGTAEDILGYFITDSGGTKVFLAEQFPAPVPMSTAGDTISIDVILAIKTLLAGEMGA
jgi:hypothetical protein